MTRLAARFAELKRRDEAALICYVVAGDPSLDDTERIVHALYAAGVDAIELGIPFSDPVADGPSIQAAAQRALDRGVTVAKTLDTLHRIRESSEIPVVLMTYYNPVHRYGLDRFAADAKTAGADATILTDLTPEESAPWITAARAQDLDTVFLLAPTSTPERIRVVGELSTGFVYCVSRTGVTGARADVPADLPELVSRARARANAPVCVGFGISEPDHVRRIGGFADGVVVGSALVSLIAKSAGDPELPERVHAYAAAMKAATRRNPAGDPM